MVNLEEAIERLRANDSTLTVLNLDKNNIGTEGAKAIAYALKFNSTLRTLDLCTNNIGAEGVKAFANALKVNSTLSYLYLGENNIGAEGAKAFANGLTVNSTLIGLRLHGNRIGDEGAKALANALKVNSTLRHLDLNSNNIGAEGAKTLANALKKNSTLSRLHLDGNIIGAEGAKELANGLTLNSTLSELYLNENKIGDEGAKALANALKENSTLSLLNLNSNNIGAEGAKELANALKVNSTLRRLDLDGNNIGDSLMNQIKDMLEQNKERFRKENKRIQEIFDKDPSPKALDFAGQDLGDLSAIVIARALKVNTSVIEMDLSKNKITAKGAKALRDALKVNSTVASMNLEDNEIDDPRIITEIEDLLEQRRPAVQNQKVIGDDAEGEEDNEIDDPRIITEIEDLLEQRKPAVQNQKVIGDNAEGEDQLGVEHITKALAEMQCYKSLTPPLVLAILGSWGSGKSFNFNLIRREFGKIQAVNLSDNSVQKKFAFVGHIYPIDFNVWTYSKGNLMASLMLTILTGLNKQLQYEKILARKGLLLKGVNLVELMEKVSEEELENFFKIKAKDDDIDDIVKGLLDVRKIGTSKVSDALVKAVTQSQEKDKQDLEVKRNEQRALESQLVEGYINKKETKENADCSKRFFAVFSRDKSSKLRALLNLGYEKYRNSLKGKNGNGKEDEQTSDEETGLLNENGTMNEKELPLTGEQAVQSIHFLRRYYKLLMAGEMSWWDLSFVLIMIIIAVVLPIALPILIPSLVEKANGAWAQAKGFWIRMISIIGPGSIAGITTVVSKIKDANNEVEAAFEKAKQDAANDNQQEERMESTFLNNEKYIDNQEKLKKNIAKVQSEISSLEQSLWLKEGAPIANVVHDRLQASAYEKELGVVHKVHMDIQKISHSMLHNKASFPRGDPRVVLFVDDLDRCPPDKVVQMLEALQLLVKTKLFVVVVAIDARYVTLCLEKEYEGVLDPNGGDRPTGLEYLEKIIQIAYKVPPITEEEAVRKYIESQCPAAENANSQSQANDRQEESPRPDARSQDQSKTLDPYTQEQSKTPDSQDQDQSKTPDSEDQDQSKTSDSESQDQSKTPDSEDQGESRPPDSEDQDQSKTSDSEDQDQSKTPDSEDQGESRPPDSEDQDQSKTPDSEDQDQSKTPDSEDQEQSQSIDSILTEEEINSLNESNKSFQQRAQLQLSSAEKDALGYISSMIQINPRALKRVVNSFKVIKIVCYRHRQGENFANEDIRIALLVLLALSASATLRPVVRRLLPKLESDSIEESNLGSLFNETIGNTERSKSRDEWIQEKLEKIQWKSEGTKRKMRQQTILFRSFSYLGERSGQEKQRPFWVKFVRDNHSVCLIPDDVAKCNTGADLFDCAKKVSMANNNDTFSLPQEDSQALRDNEKALFFELKQTNVVLSKDQFKHMPIQNLLNSDGNSIEITILLQKVEPSQEDAVFIDLD